MRRIINKIKFIDGSKENKVKRYEQVPHTADIAAKIYGKNIPELFENAAFAMFDLMAELEGLTGKDETVCVEVEGPDPESLLITWLNEVLYLSFSYDLIFYKFKAVSLENNKLRAEATGKSLKENTNKIKTEIKAATYHDLKIEKKEGVYEVTIVFDV